MIVVDKAVGSFELQTLIQRYGVPCEKVALDAADAAFEGHGPSGPTMIGVERKKVQEALDCVETGRLGGFQMMKMRKMYGFRFVIIEGQWKPWPAHGSLMQGHPKPDGTVWWTEKGPRGKVESYAKLRRYLFSLTMAGAHVMYTHDILHTAYDICELYHWFQKPWDSHTSMQQVFSGHYGAAPQELAMIPTITSRPSVTRLWALALEGIGQKMSADIERAFPSPRALANADESEWVRVPGIGLKTASNIVRQILGKKR